MESSEGFANRKAELEAKVSELESQRTTLVAEIPVIREKLETLKLERTANVLEGEVASLQSEKNALEQEIAGYSTTETVTQVTEATAPAEAAPVVTA